MKSWRQLVPLLILAGMSCAATEPPSPLDETVARAEHHAAAFLDVFSEVKCTEYVDQFKLNPNGKVEYKTRSRFDYLVIAQTSDGELNLEESRLEEQAGAHKENEPLLVTNGFATLLLVFHPYYRNAFEFSAAGDDVLDGRPVAKIRFRHIRGQRTPTVLMLRGREYPLEMMGTAWIDRETGAVERIESELQVGMEDIGLRTLHSQVSYAPVKFRGMTESPWLPKEATIEVATPRQRWRNTHHFENYQHFGVETEHKEDPSNTLSKSR